MTAAGRFEVTDHFEIAERGAFVIGRFIDGTIRPGMVAFTSSSVRFTIRAVEFLDNLAEKKFWNALIFSERLDLETIRKASPVGTVIDVWEDPGRK